MINPNELPKFKLNNQFFVYFLFSNDKIVYVGRTSTAVEVRISAHTKTKQFDSYSFIACETEIESFETAYFYILNNTPIYNQSLWWKPENVISESELKIVLKTLNIRSSKVKNSCIFRLAKKFYDANVVCETIGIDFKTLKTIIKNGK